MTNQPKYKYWSFIINNIWTSIIIDEVHRLPAEKFKLALKCIKSHVKIGLTATLLREDSRLGDLQFIIGPKLYEENLVDLMQQGYLAKPYIIEVFISMTDIFKREFE